MKGFSYEFLRDERSKGAPASRLSAYHGALVFSRFVLGVSGLERAISSRRCLGAAKSDVPRDRKQAAPLTVEQLKILHAKVQNQGEDVWNRLFAGAVLCVVYARSRWGDAQHACRWALDFDSSGLWPSWRFQLLTISPCMQPSTDFSFFQWFPLPLAW